MKEEDIDRIIDNMITEGLIKEGEQDNADFEAALRNMSDEDFLAMIHEARPQPEEILHEDVRYSIMAEESIHDTIHPPHPIELQKANRFDIDIWDETVSEPANSKTTQRKPWRIWLTAAVSAAAVLALVLIPAYRSMNAKVCESALVACEAYMPSARGGIDPSASDISEIKEELPELEADYNSALNPTGSQDYYAPNLAEAGWDLATAYLRLGERSKAKKVLTELATRYSDNEFGAQCLRIADIL